MVVVASSSSASSLLDSVPEELPFHIGRKSQSFENVSDLSSSTTDSDDGYEYGDGYDFGPLLRFNLYVADILYRYAAAAPEEEEEDRLILDKIRYLISAVGAGPVYARDSFMRHNVFRYVRSGPEIDLATDVIKHRRDVRALTRHGIRSPAFVRYNQDVPFDRRDSELGFSSSAWTVKDAKDAQDAQDVGRALGVAPHVGTHRSRQVGPVLAETATATAGEFVAEHHSRVLGMYALVILLGRRCGCRVVR